MKATERNAQQSRRPVRLGILTVSMTGALLQAAAAQEAPPALAPGTILLPTVEVQGGSDDPTAPVDGYVADVAASATKTAAPLIETPQSISVITADQLKSQAADEMGEVLRYTAGATGEPYGSDSRGLFFQLRGFNVADEAFYRDGLRQKGSDFASFMTIDPYGAERFEVLRGPSSVLYGQISPGGLLNYVTKRPNAEPLREVILETGNFGRLGASFDFTGPANADETILYRLTGHAHFTDTQIDFVDKERAFIAPAVTWRPDADTSLTVLANVQYDNNGWDIQFLPASGTVLPNPHGRIPTNRFTGEPDHDRYEQTQESVGYLLEHRFNETFTVRQNARFSHLTNEQEGVFGSGLRKDGRTFDRYGDSGESELDSVVADNQLQVDLTTGPVDHTFLFGLDYQFIKYSDLGQEYKVRPLDIFNPDYGGPFRLIGAYQDSRDTLRQLGAYAQDQLKIGRLTLVAGGRYDRAMLENWDRLEQTATVQDDQAFSKRAGLIYQFDSGLAPYASYSTSFAPVLGQDRKGNPFEPETGEQYEVGLKYQPTGWNSFVTLSAFDLTQANVITTDPEDPRFLRQTGEFHSRGVELEGVASLPAGVDLIAAYALIDAEVAKSEDGVEGNTPYGIPLHRASLWADYTVPHGRFQGWGAGLGVRYVGETWGDDENSFKVPDYAVVDAALHYERGKFGFSLNASNLFDKKYVASCFYAAAGCFYGERLTVVGRVFARW